MIKVMLDYLSETYVITFSGFVLYFALTNRWLSAQRRGVQRFGIVIAGLGVVQFCVFFALFVAKRIFGF
jgi:hypothetical protein